MEDTEPSTKNGTNNIVLPDIEQSRQHTIGYNSVTSRKTPSIKFRSLPNEEALDSFDARNNMNLL
jgi:hypothetical protein